MWSLFTDPLGRRPRCSRSWETDFSISIPMTHAILILCHAFAISKLLNSLRTSPCFASSELAAYDNVLRATTSSVTNTHLGEQDLSWTQATLPVKHHRRRNRGGGGGGRGGGQWAPNFTKGGPNGIWPLDVYTCLTFVIFDLARKYSDHLTKLHGISSQPFRSVLVNETYCCSFQISSTV